MTKEERTARALVPNVGPCCKGRGYEIGARIPRFCPQYYCVTLLTSLDITYLLCKMGWCQCLVWETHSVTMKAE